MLPFSNSTLLTWTRYRSPTQIVIKWIGQSGHARVRNDSDPSISSLLVDEALVSMLYGMTYKM